MNGQLQTVALQWLAEFIAWWALLFGLYLLVLWIIHRAEVEWRRRRELRHLRVALQRELSRIDSQAVRSMVRVQTAYAVARQCVREVSARGRA